MIEVLILVASILNFLSPKEIKTNKTYSLAYIFWIIYLSFPDIYHLWLHPSMKKTINNNEIILI